MSAIANAFFDCGSGMMERASIRSCAMRDVTGMRERAEQIGARFDIWSEVGAGTEVELLIPGSVGYGTERKD
jgi:nitrate/nitrite-specific signal transduction histidine kinase